MEKITGKFLLGKTVFFLLLVVFIGIFSLVFGMDNILVGVMFVVIALMMLSKDLGVKPLTNLTGLIIICMCLGLGAYLTLLDPFLGIMINFPLIFFVTYLTMQDMKMPFWFPFLIGYAFIMAMPVTFEELPLRLCSLLVGAIFVVVLNLIVNRNRTAKTCHAGIKGLLNGVIFVIDKKMANEEINYSEMEDKSESIMSSMYTRVKDKYFMPTNNKSVLNLAIAIKNLERTVLEDDSTDENLHDLKNLLEFLIAHEDNESEYSEVHNRLNEFIEKYPDSSPSIVTNLRIIDYELEIMENSDKTEGHEYDSDDIPTSFRYATLFKEHFRKDSVKFTFAFRMALMLTFWAFIGDYYDIGNSKWLLFTTIVIIQPYLEGTAKKSVMRLTGTFVGVVAFVIIMALMPSPEAIPLMLLALGYVFTIFDPFRYDLQVIFITVMSLLTALMLFPSSSDNVLMERVVFIVLGIIGAMVANHIILPYRVKDETSSLSTRYVSIVRNNIRELKNALNSEEDKNKSAALLVTSYAVADKIRLNNKIEPNELVTKFLTVQNEAVLGASYLKLVTKSTYDLNDKVKQESLDLLTKYGPDGKETIPDDLTSNDKYVHGIIGIIKHYNKGKKIAEDIVMG